MRKIIPLIFAVLLFACGIKAQDRSVILTYPTGFRAVDLRNLENVDALNELSVLIKKAKQENKNFKIICTGYAAPENENDVTKNIGKSRAEALETLLEEHSLIQSADEIEYKFGGIGWNILRRLVQKSDISRKSEILQILSSPDQVVLSDVHDNQALIIEELKKLNNGKVWDDIKYSVLPIIRNTLYLTTSSGNKYTIRYRTGYNSVDLDYRNNKQQLSAVIEALKEGESLNIRYSPNPGGDNDIYKNIARKRAEDLAEKLVQASKANAGNISFDISNDGWSDLKNLIEQSHENWSDEALQIINNYRYHLLKSNKSANNVRIKLLKKLEGGKIFHEMKIRMFPVISNILIVTFLQQ